MKIEKHHPNTFLTNLVYLNITDDLINSDLEIISKNSLKGRFVKLLNEKLNIYPKSYRSDVVAKNIFEYCKKNTKQSSLNPYEASLAIGIISKHSNKEYQKEIDIYVNLIKNLVNEEYKDLVNPIQISKDDNPLKIFADNMAIKANRNILSPHPAKLPLKTMIYPGQILVMPHEVNFHAEHSSIQKIAPEIFPPTSFAPQRSQKLANFPPVPPRSKNVAGCPPVPPRC